MKKVLFVCLGNICRSPMAKYIFKDLIKKNNLENQIMVDSAATSSEEVGNGIYRHAAAKLREKGIEFDNHRARQITPQDYEKYDYIVCMDERNRSSLRRIFSADPERKISSLMDYTTNPHDVADPWYTGDFSKTEQDIDAGCLAFLNFLCGND